MLPIDKTSKNLLTEIRTLIDQAKNRTVSMVNHELVLLNWNIGKRIKTEIIQNDRPIMETKLSRHCRNN